MTVLNLVPKPSPFASNLRKDNLYDYLNLVQEDTVSVKMTMMMLRVSFDQYLVIGFSSGHLLMKTTLIGEILLGILIAIRILGKVDNKMKMMMNMNTYQKMTLKNQI